MKYLLANTTKYKLLFTSLCGCLVGCLVSCQVAPDSDVVAKKYVHRYGVEVPANEWVEQGRSGQVVEVLQTGVTVTSSYWDGVLDGTVIYSFPHRSSTEAIETYTNGVLQKRQRFFPSGTLREEETFADSSTRCCRGFYESGVLRSLENYENERLVEAKYYTLDGALESEVIHGDGKCIQRDSFGQLLHVDSYTGGLLCLRTYQHLNGMPRACYSYSGDKVHGTARTYMPGGDPRSIEQWVNGEQHGLTSYFAEGECVGEAYYDHGKQTGVEKRFADQGQRVVQETIWVNGERHGPSYSYMEGKKVENWYFRGKKVTRGEFEQMSAATLH